MLVKEVMRKVNVINSDAPLLEAISRLGADGGVLAVFDGDQLRGTLSEHDIALWQADPSHDTRTAYVHDVLREHTYISAEQDVRDAAKVMRDEHVGGMVVMQGRQPVGMVALADIATRVQGAGGAGQPQVSVSLQPIAAPSILGFFGLGAAATVVGAYMAGWYGTTLSPLYLFAFAAMAGGLAQFFAGMWSYRARDGVATTVHGIWGAFWLAYGILFLLVANKTLPATTVNETYGFWFIPLAAITLSCMIAAFADNIALGVLLLALTATSICAGISLLVGTDTTWIKASGWLFVVTALISWYVATGLLLESAYRRVVLPLGRRMHGENRVGSVAVRPIEYELGEPGVRVGQ